MRVSVVINSKAGSVDETLIEEKVREALFRCDLRFLIPQCLEDTEKFAAEEIGKSDIIMICGGDGTINVTLRCLLRQAAGRELPPIAIVRSGTANDLALEIGVDRKIERSARAILEGKIKNIDLIELESETGQKSYMLTNGGVGVTAIAVDASNRFRSTLRGFATNPKTAKTFQMLAQSGYRLVKKIGPGIYTLMAAEAIRRWDPKGWDLDVEMPDGTQFSTQAAGIFVNNQPTFGSDLTSAPYTCNSDGLVNLLLTETRDIKDRFRVAINMKRGSAHELPFSRSYELKEFKLKSRNRERPLTFAGDGEILLENVNEITVRCLHRKLAVVVRA